MLQDQNCTDYYDQSFDKINYSNNEIVFKVFEECVFTDCNFSQTAFKNCKFRYCQFINCNLSLISVVCCTFVNMSFKDCKIIGVHWVHADSIWPPLTFQGCNLSQSNFLGLSLKSISITECSVRDVDFRECDLSKSNLTSNDLQNTLFCNTNLIKADFTNSSNYSINLLENKIQGAKFSMPDAVSLLNGLGIEIIV